MPDPFVLSYREQTNRSRQLRLLQDARSARVEYPLPPTWVVRITVGSMVLQGASYLVMLVMQLWNQLTLGQALHVNLLAQSPWSLVLSAIPVTLAASFGWLMAAYQWRMHRRFGDIPRTLIAEPAGLTSQWTGIWSVKIRQWPIEELTSIELCSKSWDIRLWGQINSVLCVHRRGKRSLRFKLRSNDTTLPTLIVETFDMVLFRQHIADEKGHIPASGAL